MHMAVNTAMSPALARPDETSCAAMLVAALGEVKESLLIALLSIVPMVLGTAAFIFLLVRGHRRKLTRQGFRVPTLSTQGSPIHSSIF